jgi:glutamine synthetase type III
MIHMHVAMPVDGIAGTSKSMSWSSGAEHGTASALVEPTDLGSGAGRVDQCCGRGT